MSAPIPHTHVKRMAALERRVKTLTKVAVEERQRALELQRKERALAQQIDTQQRDTLGKLETEVRGVLDDIRSLLDANVQREKRRST